MTADRRHSIEGHSGQLAVAVARAHGVETMFTLSGAHVFPMYDGAVKADPPMRLLDVRHEQTAAFAAEATGKLTRVPGLAVLTAGPGRHQRRQRDRPGPVRRLADGRGRRPRAAEPLGQRQPAGARPAADRRVGLQARPHHPDRRRHPRPAWTRRSSRPAARTAGRRSSTCRWTSSSTPRPARRRGRPSAQRVEPDADALTDDRRAAGRRPAGRCWSSAPTCGPTAPRRPRCGSSRTSASRR